MMHIASRLPFRIRDADTDVVVYYYAAVEGAAAAVFVVADGQNARRGTHLDTEPPGHDLDNSRFPSLGDVCTG